MTCNDQNSLLKVKCELSKGHEGEHQHSEADYVTTWMPRHVKLEKQKVALVEMLVEILECIDTGDLEAGGTGDLSALVEKAEKVLEECY